MRKRQRVVLRTPLPGVVLKQFVPTDAEPLFELVDQNRDHLAHLGQWDDNTTEKYPGFESVRRSITHPPIPSKLRLGIWRNRCLIGTVNLSPMTNAYTDQNDLANIGYWISEEFCGQGLATTAVMALVKYAFQRMGILTVLAQVHKENVTSQRVLERVGFRMECTEGDSLHFSLEKPAATL